MNFYINFASTETHAVSEISQTIPKSQVKWHNLNEIMLSYKDMFLKSIKWNQGASRKPVCLTVDQQRLTSIHMCIGMHMHIYRRANELR